MGRREVFRSSLIAAAIASAFAAVPAAARDETIAVSGTAAPGLNGATFSGIGIPSINNAGQVAFTASLVRDGTTAFSFNDTVLYRDATPLVREGDPTPGSSGETFGDLLNNASLNASGQVAFFSPLSPSGSHSIWRGTTLVQRQGTALAGGVTVGTLNTDPQLNVAGQIAYWSTITTSSGTEQAIWRDQTILATTGQAAPGGGTFADLGGGFRAPQISAAGHVAYWARLGGTGVSVANDEAFYKNNTLVARENDPTPVAGLTYGFLGQTPAINSSGQVAFFSALRGTSVQFGVDDAAIWRDGTIVARKGDPAAGLPAGLVLDSFSNRVRLNDAGQLAFWGTVRSPTPGLVDFSNDEVIYRNSVLIAREGAPAPGQGAGVIFGSLFEPLINNQGHVAVFATLAGAGVDSTNDGAIFIGDGIELVPVVRKGDLRGGKAVSGIDFFPHPGQRLNDHGQLAYSIVFADGSNGAFLFTPDLHWRRAESGSWDAASNWTLGIDPSQPHDVKIDPSVSLTVTGPAGTRSVRTLEIGGGNGIATLSMLGGAINSVAGAVQVFANGVVTGDGVIAGGMVNLGSVRAQNVTILGGLTNLGVMEGSGRINANISNTFGRISVAAGESMRIGGMVNNAATGSMDVIGGALEITGNFTNAGQLLAREATLRFSGGAANSGQLGFSFGTSDIFGNITNQLGGKIIVSGASNATFADDLVNHGEVRASAGSKVVYFGAVSGSGSFTGTGTHFFEGIVSPGSSPGAMTVSNAVYGFGSTLAIELADGAHDKLIAGSLLLEGGRLLVSLLGGFAPAFGSEFDILDWTTLSGTFGTLDLPALGSPYLVWDTSDLYLDGTISVAAIPEPQTYVLLFAGLGLLGFAARRRSARLSAPLYSTLFHRD